MEMLSADQSSVPDKEYLYHHIPLILGHSDNIPVIHALARDLLLLGNLAHTL